MEIPHPPPTRHLHSQHTSVNEWARYSKQVHEWGSERLYGLLAEATGNMEECVRALTKVVKVRTKLTTPFKADLRDMISLLSLFFFNDIVAPG